MWVGWAKPLISIHDGGPDIMQFKFAALIIQFFMLASCATSQPVPQLVAAAMPNSGTPSTITGEPYEACLAEHKFRKSYTIDPQGVYEPSSTYKFAEALFKGRQTSAYATRIRAYKIGVEGPTLFRSNVKGYVICYYELQSGGLRYLASLRPDAEGRVDRNAFSVALMYAYEAMSGKSRTVILFGG